MATPNSFISFSKRRGLSADGRCRAYSSDADGTGWSEGVGLVLLERLQDARRNGHHVLGVIRGSAVNSDGASNGLTAPSGLAQQQVIQTALAQAGLSPADVDVVEGHGTATPLGDPIEVQALISTYGNGGDGRRRPDSRPLLLGSVKSNIGHTQAAAGVAGLIKMVHAIQKGVAPASLHISEPSRHIDWEESGVELLANAKQWPVIPCERGNIPRPRRAAVSSFGIGGTNAHVILEQPAEQENGPTGGFFGNPTPPATPIKGNWTFPWLLSGADEAALRAQAQVLLTSKTVCSQYPSDVAFSLATTRSALRFRAAVTPALGGNYEAALMALAQDQPHPDVVTGFSNGQASTTKPRLAFLFSGQGARLPGRAALEELCIAFPVFADAFRGACDELDPHLDLPLNSVLKKNEGSDRSAHLDRTDFAQAFLFAFEVAMFRLLESFSIRPDFVTGHSLGEIAAAHASGALSLREAATIVTARGKLMASLPNNGIMVSISASEEDVAAELLRHKHNFPGGPATIAAVNSQSSIVVSGTTETVKAVADIFAGLGRRVTPLRNVRHAFHSPMMDPMLADLEAELTSLMEGGRKATIPLVSSVSGSRTEASQLRSTAHWIRHVRQPVRFADAVSQLQKEGVSAFVEVGPSAVLSTHVAGSIAISSQVNKLLDTLGRLWVRGVQVDWRAVFRGTEANRVDLPVYAFQRRRYWLDPPKPAAVQPEDTGSLGHGILLHATSIPGTSKVICSGHLSVTRQPWLRDHVVGGQMIVPAAALTELALRASRECTRTEESMLLEEFTFVGPLILGPQEDAGLQIQVLMGEPEGHGSRSVDIYSRPKGAPTQHEWTRHATGTLKPASLSNTGEDKFNNNAEPIGSEDEYQDDRQLADVSRAYDALASAGISYGPSFQRVRAVWRPHSDIHDSNELRAYIDPPQTQSQMYALHPALLDAALHAPLLAAPDAAAGKIRLPFILRGVRISAASATGSIVVRIRELGEDRFSVNLTDKSTGALLAEVSEVVTRAWTGPAAAGPATGDLYRLEWIESAQVNTNGESTKPSRTSDELYRVRGAHVDGGQSDKDAIENDVHGAVAEVLGVIRKWSAENAYDSGRLVIVTAKATIDSDPDLVSAAVWGFVRSAQAELSGGRIVLVDLDGSPESEAALLPALCSTEEVFAMRSGRVMIPRLNKIPLAANQALISPETSASTSTLDVSGTVLITGATGGLGALLSKHIARIYGAKHLLLVSRSGMKAPGAPKLYDDLSSADVVVQIEECDCSDREQLATLFANNSSQGRPPISAIIHCAGVVDDAVLSSQTPERVSRVLRPKVDAAWHLQELAPATVRSFVLFSSFVGILGNEGQAAYTAGNAFLDALARFRVARGLPALSLAWGPWLNEVGMAAENRLKAHNPRLGNAKTFTDQQGLHLFDMAMQKSTPPQPVMAPLLVDGPLPLMSPGTGTASRTKAPSQGGAGKWRTKLAKIQPEKRDDELLSLVRGEVAAVLGYQDQNLLDRPLADLGFDSSSSVLLSNRLRRFTGLLDLPVTLALDYETLPALVQYLSGRLDIARLGTEPQTEAGVQGASTEGDIGTASLGQASGEDDKGQKLNGLHTARPGRDTDHDHVDTQAFRGLTALYKRLCQLDQYTAAGGLLGCASLALPKFKAGSNMASYAAAAQRLAAGPLGCPTLPLPLVFLPSFLPPIIAQGFRGSAYSALASEMKGERDVFELPHPEGLAVPEDLEALAAVHVSTIREQFGGPVVLAGYSAGGIIAHAVASRLSEEGHSEEGSRAQLAGLVLIDTYLNMAGRDDPEWLNALPAEALTARDGGLLHMVGDSDLALAKVGGYFRTLEGFKLRPLPDALPTLFLRAQYPTSNMPKSEDEWRPSWPRADVTVDIPGSHLELLDKRCAPAAAAEIRQWIRRCAV
ncbi:polyketide synthetase [Diaporthe eres]